MAAGGDADREDAEGENATANCSWRVRRLHDDPAPDEPAAARAGDVRLRHRSPRRTRLRVADGAAPRRWRVADRDRGWRRLRARRRVSQAGALAVGLPLQHDGALLCLAHHPERRNGEEARRALDLLLGRETKEAHPLGFEVARLIGAEQTRGFTTFYARFDLAMILDLCWRVGATLDDPRIAEIVDFVLGLQGEYGLWNHARPQASRWLTFDLLRSLSRLDETGAWLSAEPRTPFQTYPKQERRY